MFALIPARFYLYGAIGLAVLLGIRWWTNRIAEEAQRKGELKNEQVKLDQVNKQADVSLGDIKQNVEQVRQLTTDLQKQVGLTNSTRKLRETELLKQLVTVQDQLKEAGITVATVPASDLDTQIKEELSKLRQSSP